MMTSQHHKTGNEPPSKQERNRFMAAFYSACKKDLEIRAKKIYPFGVDDPNIFDEKKIFIAEVAEKADENFCSNGKSGRGFRAYVRQNGYDLSKITCEGHPYYGNYINWCNFTKKDQDIFESSRGFTKINTNSKEELFLRFMAQQPDGILNLCDDHSRSPTRCNIVLELLKSQCLYEVPIDRGETGFWRKDAKGVWGLMLTSKGAAALKQLTGTKKKYIEEIECPASDVGLRGYKEGKTFRLTQDGRDYIDDLPRGSLIQEPGLDQQNRDYNGGEGRMNEAVSLGLIDEIVDGRMEDLFDVPRMRAYYICVCARRRDIPAIHAEAYWLLTVGNGLPVNPPLTGETKLDPLTLEEVVKRCGGSTTAWQRWKKKYDDLFGIAKMLEEMSLTSEMLEEHFLKPKFWEVFKDGFLNSKKLKALFPFRPPTWKEKVRKKFLSASKVREDMRELVRAHKILGR